MSTGLSESWATLWEALADQQPDHAAVVVGQRAMTWRELDDSGARVAAFLAANDVGHGIKVAQLLYNCPEYLITVYAAFKQRATPVNVNYRYLADEIVYVLDNADAEVLVFHGAMAERVAAAAARLPKLRLLLQVDDGAPLLEGATFFHDVVAQFEPAPRIERSGQDVLFLYTGGTTGMPKGVMWRHVDLWGALASTGYLAAGLELPTTPQQVGETAAMLQAAGRSPVNLCAPPLMHGTALFLAIGAFVMGGSVVLLGNRGFDANELLGLVEQRGVTQLSIVGDAFARPIVAALDAGSYDLSSLQRIVSTGATLSSELKVGLQRAAPSALIMDMIGASEGGPFALCITPPGTKPADTAVFMAPPNAVTLDDDGRVIARGTGKPGRLAVSGPMPVGYFKDAAKSAATFPVVDGVRYTVPGDFAVIDDDGTVHLLGRGSVCINTGGEKVYPEEVEVAARSHAGVLDANAIGVPDERFGEIVVLVASRAPGSTVPDDELIAHIRTQIAPYKAPKRIVWVDAVYRSPSGKADYRWAKEAGAAAAQ